MVVMPLEQLKKGNGAIVREIVCQGKSRQRLMELGLVKGARVTVKRFAPLGDPMIIEVGDCEMAVRKADARNILVESVL